MKKGAKIAIAIITPVVLASTIVGTVLGIKNSKENTTPANPDTSVTTPAQPDQPNIPNVPEQPVQPDQPNTPDQPIVEKTEQEYMQECKEKLKTTIVNGLAQTGRLNAKINSYRVNQLTGKVYINVSYESRYGDKYTEFMTYETNLGDISSLTYKQVSEKMEELQLTKRVASSVLQKAVSEELYNQLCEYVLGKVGLDGAEVLNATKFSTNKNRMYETTLSVFKNNKIYQVSASVISDGSQEDHINKLMTEGRTKEIKIVSEEDFKEFFTE